jgi:hypothetical protein
MAVKIKPYQQTVNNAGDREAVSVVNRCELVEIKELISITPKQLFYSSDVPSGGTQFEHSAGTSLFIPAGRRGYFEAGETIAYIATATGSTTFQRLEHLVDP